MDIMPIVGAYMDKRAPDDILEMYSQCNPGAVTNNYEKLNLLHVACRNAHPEAVAFLLAQGFDPNEPAGNEDTPMFLLAKRDHMGSYTPREGDIYKAACLLLDARAGTLRKDDEGRLCHHYAAQRGNHELLRAMLDKGQKLTKPDGDGNTGLHLIVEASYNPIRDLEKARERGAPPEQLAQYEEKLEELFRAAAVLVEAGVDVEAKNDMLETAPQMAVRRGAKKIAALLNGSYVPGADGAEEALKAGGMTLHQAVRQRDREAMQAIVAAGADVDEVSDEPGFEGMTPLAVACSTCDADMVEQLLLLGANPAVKNGVGAAAAAWMFSPITNLHKLQQASAQKTPSKIVSMMAGRGFDVNSSITDKSETLLTLACQNGQGGGRDSVHYMVVDECLRQKADVNIANLNGQTPLMLACVGDFEAMENIQIMLLEAGAEAALKDSGGNTALHYAACNSSLRGAFAMAEMLFDAAQPDANAVNNAGKTALDYAVERNNEQLVNLLLQQV